VSPVLELTLPSPSRPRRVGLLAASAVVPPVVTAPSPAAATAVVRSRQTMFEVYDHLSAPGRTAVADHSEKWSNIHGVGEMAGADTRSVSGNRCNVTSPPFRTASDTSVFDQSKDMAVSTKTFPVPTTGIAAVTPGTVTDKAVHDTSTATAHVHAASTQEGQQVAGNVIDVGTGQLFDWFMSGHRAVALMERLPWTVTGGTTDAASPDYVGRDTLRAQTVREVPAGPGAHPLSIGFSLLDVSVPQRLFGQGVRASFDNCQVTTTVR